MQLLQIKKKNIGDVIRTNTLMYVSARKYTGSRIQRDGDVRGMYVVKSKTRDLEVKGKEG